MNRLLLNSVRLTKHKSNFNTIAFTRMKSYLINDEKYSFLKDLGLNEQNPGVFSKHGRWFGDGQVSSHPPTSY